MRPAQPGLVACVTSHTLSVAVVSYGPYNGLHADALEALSFVENGLRTARISTVVANNVRLGRERRQWVRTMPVLGCWTEKAAEILDQPLELAQLRQINREGKNRQTQPGEANGYGQKTSVALVACEYPHVSESGFSLMGDTRRPNSTGSATNAVH
ncbi:unnamed protein product [Calicophoron daubneyi]|uniref:Uncharacterized protein n=1 Tax=Calicophoron daubneyi TaxID=300641 RepID=A0AAV2TKD2_CALDB